VEPAAYLLLPSEQDTAFTLFIKAYHLAQNAPKRRVLPLRASRRCGSLPTCFPPNLLLVLLTWDEEIYRDIFFDDLKKEKQTRNFVSRAASLPAIFFWII